MTEGFLKFLNVLHKRQIVTKNDGGPKGNCGDQSYMHF